MSKISWKHTRCATALLTGWLAEWSWKWCDFWKITLISLDKSSSSQNEWNDRKLSLNWQKQKKNLTCSNIFCICRCFHDESSLYTWVFSWYFIKKYRKIPSYHALCWFQKSWTERSWCVYFGKAIKPQNDYFWVKCSLFCALQFGFDTRFTSNNINGFETV